MGLPQVQYDVGPGTTVTLEFQRGPSDFRCWREARAHDNVASSGLARERVVEAVDVMLSLSMQHMIVGGDYAEWGAFAEWWIAGGWFYFWPDRDAAPYCKCVSEDTAWQPSRTGIRKYGAAMKWRMIGDWLTPEAVMEAYYGG